MLQASGREAPLRGVVALAIAAALAGMLLAAQLVARAQPATESEQDVPTSFGTLRVTRVDLIDGLTPEDLAGMTHGIQNLVPSDKVQVAASVLLTNRGQRPVDYSPARQFRVVSSSGAAVEPLSGQVAETAVLPAHASLTTSISYSASRDGGELWLEYLDPGRGSPIRVRLGSIDPTPGPAQPVSDHH